jgi:hypothetical protein
LKCIAKIYKMNKIVFLLLLFGHQALRAQSVGIQTSSPDPSAALDVSSTQSGVLVPRMNALQMQAIPTPATGLLVFNTDNTQFFYFDGAAWQSISSSSSVPSAAPGTMVLLSADETTASNVNVLYSPCNTGTSSGTIKTYALAPNSFSRIIAEAEGYFEIGANGGSFNSATVTMNLPGGINSSNRARRSVTGGGTGDTSWHFPFKVSASGAATAGGTIDLNGSLSLGGCTGGRIVVTSFRVYGVH